MTNTFDQYYDWRNSPDVETRACAVVAEMTLDEKVELVTGDENFMFGFYSAQVKRVGIPELGMADGPPGVRINNGSVHDGKATALPAPIGLAATWNTDLATRYGDVLGQETRASGHNVFLGPGVDIARIPIGGRNFESFGEDPILTARIAASEIKAIQKHQVLACLKHFAVNNQEYERSKINVGIEEKALRELYLLPFEILTKTTGVAALMGAFNRVNGTYACEHPQLLKDILRDEWGFKGWVMSDYGATHSTVPSALAGLDQEQPSGIYYAGLLKTAVERGHVPVQTLDEMCRRILRTLIGIGVMDRTLEISALNLDAHRDVALAVAEEAVVLLKNDNNFLPLDTSRLRSLAVIGIDADGLDMAGGGSGKVRPVGGTSLLEGIRQRLGDGVLVGFARGCDPISAADLLPGRESLPSSFLRTPDDTGYGLHTEFWSNPDFFGEPMLVQTMPQVALNLGFFNFPGFGAASASYPAFPFELTGRISARFSGRLVVPQGGQYRLSVAMLGSVRIWLDGVLVLDFRYHGPGRDGGGAGGSGGFAMQADDDVKVPPSSEAAARALGHGEIVEHLVEPVPPSPVAPPTGSQSGGEAGPLPETTNFTLELDTRAGGHQIRIDYAADSPEQGNLTGAQIRLGWEVPERMMSHHIAEAVETARGVDLTVIAVRCYDSEHMDRPSLLLPNGQAELIRKVAEVCPNTVVVTMAGGPVDTQSWDADVKAILHGWYLGQEQGIALSRILFGDVNPSGKLPVTFPQSDTLGLFNSARHYPGIDGQVHYDEGVLSGYRGFDARGIAPQYPFGFGLSYTTFAYGSLEVTAEGETVRVACDITNTGSRRGAETAQLYIGLPDDGQPPKRLADWKKIWLDPGQTERLTFCINPESAERPLSVWDGRWTQVSGIAKVFVGSSSLDIRLQSTFEVPSKRRAETA